jgi:hypothetical protein
VKEMQLHIERMLIDKSQQGFAWEIERKEMQARVAKVQGEREQAEKIAEMVMNARVNEMQMEIEKQRLAHMVEVEKIKAEYENNMKDLRLLHE